MFFVRKSGRGGGGMMLCFCCIIDGNSLYYDVDL